MIVPMIKYDFVLFHGQREDFLNKLQDLGLVDITTTDWEPNDRERELINSIDKHNAAIARLKALAATEGYEAGTPYKNAEEAWDKYLEASERYDSLTTDIALVEKEAADLRVWGTFDATHLRELEKSGIELRFFSVYTKEFEGHLQEWNNEYTIVPISEVSGTTYFVVVATPGQEVMINAQELRPLTETYEDKEKEVVRLGQEREKWAKELARGVASVELIEAHASSQKESLHFSQIVNTARDEAEGTLVIMEGWATKETAGKVDEFVEEYPNLFYIKAAPTPDDQTPTLLKNNKFNRMFEFIGNFYALPKYGSMDLTPYFGPFYVLFFGLCLADAGYGLLFLIGGIILGKKLPAEYKSIARLVSLCGLSTMVCGAFMGSFFGIEFAKLPAFEGFSKYVLNTDNLFVLALVIGVIQIFFAMTLKVIMYIKQYGVKYALSTIGWMLTLGSVLASFALPMAGVDGFAMGTPAFWCVFGLGLFMMLFLNSPGKNPLANFGSGLWNLYNSIIGFISDFLSYIRLFAIGLSGGILALVFNQLAVGLSPDIPVVRQLMIVAILLIGHGINFFMSSLSSFVHPMRLTFVEFYNNAGFEIGQRAFTPFKRDKNNK